MPYVNFLAVLVSAIVGMGIGAAWYSPALFGRPWMALMGRSPESVAADKGRGMGRTYVTAFIGLLLMAYVLAEFVFFAGATSIIEGFQVGGWTWLGFVAPVLLGSVLWEKRPWKLFWINALQYLVVLLVMSGILAMW